MNRKDCEHRAPSKFSLDTHQDLTYCISITINEYHCSLMPNPNPSGGLVVLFCRLFLAREYTNSLHIDNVIIVCAFLCVHIFYICTFGVIHLSFVYSVPSTTCACA